jgi:signal peptidase I
MRSEDDRDRSPAEFRPAVFIPAELPEHADSTESATPAPSLDAPLPRPSALERLRDEIFVWFKTLVSAAVYATIIVTFGFQVARVDGESMIPTLENRDRLIVNKLVYNWTDPRVGDVVMHYWPEDPSKSFVKRVVAAEGDTIRSDAGKIYRNEVLMDDSFIPAQYRMQDTWGPVTVRRGYYFVLGDHRNNSSDSRIWGEVPKKYIIGKIQVRWWPVNHARIFENP